jgi:C-terminal processing protease CtpA/Prc
VGLAGIGVFLEQRGRERYCVVNSLQQRGSAEREGTLRLGDELITVDGKDTIGYDMENVRGTLMGRCGTLVCLGILPRGAADGVAVQVALPPALTRARSLAVICRASRAEES